VLKSITVLLSNHEIEINYFNVSHLILADNMQLIHFFKKPEYYLQPFAIVKRLFIINKSIITRKVLWGNEIEVNTTEVIGRAISDTGIYDLGLSEILWRLTEPGNFVIDIGANIGYTTNIFSVRAGKNGKVWAFEPNPLLLPTLKKNIAFLKNDNTILFPHALSNITGKGHLVFPNFFKTNQGVAFIGSANDGEHCEIELKKLDDLLSSNETINVLKIDVEGHESEVFEGTNNTLNKKLITHIVFEDHNRYPSKVSELLLKKGYEIFRIEKGWLKPTLKNPYSKSGITAWEPQNYLATLDSKFVRKKLRAFLFKCL
jgi:FkbM family methyltransferase